MLDSIWLVVEVCIVGLYLWGVLIAVGHLWGSRKDCFTCTYRQACVRSCVLAFLITPSVITDFWLFSVPGPAALGFLLLLPGLVFAGGHRIDLLLATSEFYLLPWTACSVLIFGAWWLIRRQRLHRRSAGF